MPIFVDNSILTTVAQCDTKTVIRYILGLTTREERATFNSGTAGHEAMATYFRTSGDAIAANQRFAEVYEDWANLNVPPDDRLSFDNTSKIVATWFDNHPIAKLCYIVDPNLIEIGFNFPLDDAGEYIFVGRIDAIVQDRESGHLRILDHKFTGQLNGRFARGFRMDTQFSGYIWAARQQLGQPIDGGYVNAIEMSKLPSDPTRKCPKHAVPYDECGFLHVNDALMLVNRSPKQIDRWKRDALALAKQFGELKAKYTSVDYLPAVRMQGQFIYGACSNCEANEFCFAGKPMNMVDSLFTYSPWLPFSHAFGEQNDGTTKV